MKRTISFEPWREHAFFVPVSGDQAKPLPEFAHLLMTVPGRSRTVRDALINLIDSASEQIGRAHV